MSDEQTGVKPSAAGRALAAQRETGELVCASCGQTFVGLLHRAQTCSTRCRQALARKRRREATEATEGAPPDR